MTPSPSSVALQYQIRLTAREIVASAPQVKTASAARVRQEFTEDVLAAFGEGMFLMDPQMRLSAGFGRRLKQLWEIFQQAPRAWEQFKKMLGIRAEGAIALAKELPGAIKRMLQQAKKYLARIGKKLRELPLVALYFDAARKLPAFGDLLKDMTPRLPESVRRTLQSISAKANTFAEFVDEVVSKYPLVKPASVVLSAAIFGIIWMNVYEISWDIPEIIRGFLGGYSWTELLESLPESGSGFLLSLLFPGVPMKFFFKVVVPVTIALRLAYLYKHKLIEYVPGKALRVKWEEMGGQPEGAPAGVAL